MLQKPTAEEKDVTDIDKEKKKDGKTSDHSISKTARNQNVEGEEDVKPNIVGFNILLEA